MAALTSGPNEKLVCTGLGTEDDDLIIPSMEKTTTGSYTGTAHWRATIDVPRVKLASSQLTVDATVDQPYSLTYDASVTATPIDGNDRHLRVDVEGWAQNVRTKGGGGTGVVTFAPGSFWETMQTMARKMAQSGLVPASPGDAAALQNPATVTLPPDQPGSAYFKLEFRVTLPDPSAHQTPLAPFEVTGADELGGYDYTVGGQIGLSGSPPRQ